MPKIFFETKENNNRRREAEFLRFTPDQRFCAFLKMVDELAIFQTNKSGFDKGNLVLEKKRGKR
jgi:hypothetical protein